MCELKLDLKLDLKLELELKLKLLLPRELYRTLLACIKKDFLKKRPLLVRQTGRQAGQAKASLQRLGKFTDVEAPQ